jgi:hypothetical protein
MGASAAHAAAFYSEVATSRRVWGIKDTEGFPAPRSSDGNRAMPFWSSEQRAVLIIETVPAYSGFEPISIGLDEFCTRWIPGLEKDGLMVGLNWSGERATGYDVQPSDIICNLDSAHRSGRQ